MVYNGKNMRENSLSNLSIKFKWVTFYFAFNVGSQLHHEFQLTAHYYHVLLEVIEKRTQLREHLLVGFHFYSHEVLPRELRLLLEVEVTFLHDVKVLLLELLLDQGS